jgi:hypothetical protein
MSPDERIAEYLGWTWNEGKDGLGERYSECNYAVKFSEPFSTDAQWQILYKRLRGDGLWRAYISALSTTPDRGGLMTTSLCGVSNSELDEQTWTMLTAPAKFRAECVARVLEER